MFLFRLSGSFLLRIAERQFLAVLFHEPPRRARGWFLRLPYSGKSEHHPTPRHIIRAAGMGEKGFAPRLQFALADPPSMNDRSREASLRRRRRRPGGFSRIRSG